MATIDLVAGEAMVAPKKRRGRQIVGPVVRPRIKVIRSLMGSDLTFPTRRRDGMEVSLTAHWDRDIFLPQDFADDPYVLDAVAKRLAEIREADEMPSGPEPYPDGIESDPMLKGWLTSLLYGPYTQQFKDFLTDWRNPKLASTGARGAATRVVSLKTRILPLVRCAMQYEAKNQSRKELLADLKKVEKFIVEEEWQWDVQSAR